MFAIPNATRFFAAIGIQTRRSSTATQIFWTAVTATLAALAGGASQSAYAAISNWDGDTSTAWGTAANWNASPANNLNDDIANFNLPTYGGNPVYAPNAGTTSIKGVTIGGSNGEMTITTTFLNIGSSGIDVATGAGPATINGGIRIGSSQSWINNDDSRLTLSNLGRFLTNVGDVSPFTLTLGGTGTGGTTINNVISNGGTVGTIGLIINTPNSSVALGNNNTLTGGIALNAGTLIATHNGGLGQAANTVAFGGGNLEIRAAGPLTNVMAAINMTSAGTTITPNRDTPGAPVAHILTGPATLGGGQTMVISPGSNFTTDTAYGLRLHGNKTLTGNTNYTINGNGSGDGTLILAVGTLDTQGATRTLTFDSGSGTGVRSAALSGIFTGSAGTLILTGNAPVTVGALTSTGNAIQVNSTIGGIYTFNGNSSYTGGTTLTAGVININNGGNAGAGPLGNGGIFAINGGTINNTSGGAMSLQHSNPISIGGDFAFGTSAGTASNDLRLPGAVSLAANQTITLNGAGALTLGGKLTNTGDSVRTLTVNNGAGTTSASLLTIGSYDLTGIGSTAARNNIINGTGNVTISGEVANGASAGSGLTKAGEGTLTLSGTNTFSGGLTIQSGTVKLGNESAAGAGLVTLGVPGNATSGFLDLNGGPRTIDSLATAGTAASQTIGNSAGEPAILNYTGATTSAFGGVIQDGPGSSTTGVAVNNSGAVLNLSGANTYTGTTSVLAGNLRVNGSIAAGSTVEVAAAGTLSGTGTINGLTAITGTHSPGDVVGVQTFNADLTYSAGSIVNWDLLMNSTGGSAVADQVAVPNGNVTFAGATGLNLAFTGPGSTVAWSDSFWGSDRSWLLYDLSTGVTNGIGDFSISTQDWLDSTLAPLSASRPDASFAITQLGQDVYITYVAVPEPQTVALLGAGGAAMAAGLLRRRRAGRR
jgi:fibronectin-binding autotransporter adhesin